MIEEGVVVGVKGALASVRMEPRGGCGTCRVCATGPGGARIVDAENAACALQGDRVSVEIADARHLRAACMVYLLPVAALVGGYAAGALLWHAETAGFLGGIAGLGCVILFIRRYDRRLSRRGEVWHRIIGVIREQGDEENHTA